MYFGFFKRSLLSITGDRSPGARKARGASPPALFLTTYLAAILVGTVLLVLPVSSAGRPTTVVDALFTAASAICVTGLTVVDTGTHFSSFGQSVILLLIQAGGLGIMTFSVFFVLILGARVPFRHRVLMQESFASTPVPDIYGLVKAIFLYTLVAEAIGALVLFFCFAGEFSFSRAAWVSLFHSISAFCNAGFSTFSGSLKPYVGSLPINLIFMALIILGGLGFPVVYEINKALRERKGLRVKISLQVKIVVLTSALLIFVGWLFFYSVEYYNHLAPQGAKGKVLGALFTSVTARTAGFNTLDTAALTNPSLVFLLFLMFVGASPGSTGGGIKTTTFAMVVLALVARIQGRTHINCFKKTIDRDTVSRALTLFLCAVGFVFVVTILIMVFEAWGMGFPAGRGLFLEHLFEVVSAFGTVGLSMGVTSSLSVASKLMLAVVMLAGRVGILTFAYVMLGRAAPREMEYARESIMVG